MITRIVFRKVGCMSVEMWRYLFRKGRRGGGSGKKGCKWKSKISGMR